MKQMATYIIVLKREFQQVKDEKKKLRTEYDKCRRIMLTKEQEFIQVTSELSTVTECYSRSEDDLKQREKELDTLKKKLGHLKRAIVSPCAMTSASSSFIETLMEESPQVRQAHVTPLRLKPSTDENGEIDLDMNESGSASPHFVKPSPNTNNKLHCEENQMKFVKITSAGCENPAKRVKRDVQDISNITGLGNFNIFKKKSSAGDLNSVFRKGYDGLGGHTSFTQHQGRPGGLKVKPLKTVSRVVTKNGQMKKVPPLPSMEQFINLT